MIKVSKIGNFLILVKKVEFVRVRWFWEYGVLGKVYFIWSCLKMKCRFLIIVVKNVLFEFLIIEDIVVVDFLIKDLWVVLLVVLFWVGDFSFEINLDV